MPLALRRDEMGISDFNTTINTAKMKDEAHLSLVPHYYTMTVLFHIEIHVFSYLKKEINFQLCILIIFYFFLCVW